MSGEEASRSQRRPVELGEGGGRGVEMEGAANSAQMTGYGDKECIIAAGIWGPIGNSDPGGSRATKRLDFASNFIIPMPNDGYQKRWN